MTIEKKGHRAIVASSTDWGLSTCVETKGPNTRSNRDMICVENHLSVLLAAYRGPSLLGMRDSSSKGGGHVQDMAGSTPMLCCAVHALSITGT